jgi:Ca-activated chloride channel family protein
VVSVLAEFHFLRPLWLLALLPLAWLLFRGVTRAAAATAWERVIDPELLRSLRSSSTPPSSWPAAAGCLGAVIGIVALAGPTWQRIPQPLFETHEARVIVLDLSQSMDAQDVHPSRLADARFAADKLLEQLPGGRFGVVAFAGAAFTVVPLTDDRNTARHLLKVLTTDLMPVRGGRVAAGIDLGLTLLKNGGALRGDLILLTDSAADDEAHAAARAAAAAGHRLWVIGIGTPAGAPVPLPEGGLLKDRHGSLVLPVLEETSLKSLAAAGGGRYERLTGAGVSGHRDEWTPERVSAAQADAKFQTDTWRDEGRWLVLVLVLLAAFAFRRGGMAAACLLVHLIPSPAHAQDLADWRDLWRSKNEIALQYLEAGLPDAAARTFSDPQWRGVAEYRAGAYVNAIESFASGDSAIAHYNLGNALARAQRLSEAVAAYDKALEQAPDMDDARFNRDLVQSLLAQRPQENPDEGGSQPSKAGGSSTPGADDESHGQGAGSKPNSTLTPRPGEGQGHQSAKHGSGKRATSDANASDGDPGERETAQGDSLAAGNRAVSQTSASNRPDATSGSTSSQQGTKRDAGNPGSGKTGRDSGQSSHSQAGADGSSGRSMGGGESGEDSASDIRAQAIEPWLRQVNDDPGGLLRRKFQRQQERQPTQAEVEQPW